MEFGSFGWIEFFFLEWNYQAAECWARIQWKHKIEIRNKSNSIYSSKSNWSVLFVGLFEWIQAVRKSYSPSDASASYVSDEHECKHLHFLKLPLRYISLFALIVQRIFAGPQIFVSIDPTNYPRSVLFLISFIKYNSKSILNSEKMTQPHCLSVKLDKHSISQFRCVYIW